MRNALPDDPIPSHGTPADIAAITQVVESFRLALIQKDKPAYMALFFSKKAEEIGWQSVVDDSSLAAIRVQRPEAIKARRRADNTFVTLIDNIVADPAPQEETVKDLTVDTDGETATVSFNYEYLSNGVMTNYGREHWQLVRTEKGWKIYSVIYTVRLSKR